MRTPPSPARLLAGSDIDSATLTFALVPGSATNGTVTINPATGAYSFTPAANYHGPASFQYVVNDGSLDSAAKAVSLTVSPVNDAPVAAVAAETASGYEDTTITGTLLAGSDIDSATLTFALVPGSATNGTVTINPATGAYSFTPAANYHGPASFQYVVNDGSLDSAPKAVSLTVSPVNDAPVAAVAAETASGNEDSTITGTLLAGSDIDSTTLTFALVPALPQTAPSRSTRRREPTASRPPPTITARQASSTWSMMDRSTAHQRR